MADEEKKNEPDDIRGFNYVGYYITDKGLVPVHEPTQRAFSKFIREEIQRANARRMKAGL
jgi:hypothetical protein